MVEKSTGDLSRARHVDELSDGRQPFYNGTTLVLLDAPRGSGAARCTAAPGLRPQPCTNCMTKPMQANCQEHTGLHRVQVSAEVHRCRPACHLAKPGLERLGGVVQATRHLEYGSDAGSCDALQKLLTFIQWYRRVRSGLARSAVS